MHDALLWSIHPERVGPAIKDSSSGGVLIDRHLAAQHEVVGWAVLCKGYVKTFELQ